MKEALARRVAPDFLVVGAAKAGTTALFRLLRSHPSVYIPPIKECRFFSQMPRDFRGGLAAKFANEGPREWEEYQRLFTGFEHCVCGDISNDYFFYYRKSIANILKYLGPDVPIVIVLRNPIDRIYSQYLHAVRLGAEREEFEAALSAMAERERQNYVWSMLYQKVGMSADATEAYLSAFRRVRVYLFEEMFSKAAMINLQRFIGVEPMRWRPVERVNANPRHLPRSKVLNLVVAGSHEFGTRVASNRSLPGWMKAVVKRGIEKIESCNVGTEAGLRAEVRRKVAEIFAGDIDRLEKILGRDLESWRS